MRWGRVYSYPFMMVWRFGRAELSAPFVAVDLVIIFIRLNAFTYSIFNYYINNGVLRGRRVLGVLRTGPPWREK